MFIIFLEVILVYMCAKKIPVVAKAIPLLLLAWCLNIVIKLLLLHRISYVKLYIRSQSEGQI